VTLYVNPQSSLRLEGISYRFKGKSDGSSFLVVVVFDLARDKAGVLMMPSNSTDIGKDVLFQTWQDRGKPTSEVLELKNPSQGQQNLVRAQIMRKARLNQDVWVLKIWKGNC
jgi:hypothetical protein